MGSIPSVSLPAGQSCRGDCECQKKCYAGRIERLRPAVRKAYESNYKLLQESPDVYWREVEASIMMSRFFRFHVSGDIPDMNYFYRMVQVANRQRHCEILCFTKKYDVVNEFLLNQYSNISTSTQEAGIEPKHLLPKNLHIILSGWPGLNMDNPFGLPEAHVRFKDGSTTAKPSAKECGGNCTECACTDDGCWTLQYGEQVVFNEH